MEAKFLVTSPRITPDAAALMQAARDMGQQAIQLPTFRPTPALEGVSIAVYGEPLFAMILTASLDHVVLAPSADWLTSLPERYTRRKLLSTTMGAARGYDQPRFVKTLDNLKGFDARVYESGRALPSRDFYPDDYAVLVSEPVHWAVEYRCFVLERELVALSVYLRDGLLAKSASGEWLRDAGEEAEAEAFCTMLLRDSAVPIPPACVIDVGVIAGRGWAVIEANPAYGSGIYGCDPRAVLTVVNRATLRASEVGDADRPWVTVYEVEG